MCFWPNGLISVWLFPRDLRKVQVKERSKKSSKRNVFVQKTLGFNRHVKTSKHGNDAIASKVNKL